MVNVCPIFQARNKQLHSTNERMEMELLYSRALDMNGASAEDEDGMEPTIYKQKYERVMKELDFTKKRLQQQHEDDLEQLMALKKQLEKKVRKLRYYLPTNNQYFDVRPSNYHDYL